MSCRIVFPLHIARFLPSEDQLACKLQLRICYQRSGYGLHIMHAPVAAKRVLIGIAIQRVRIRERKEVK